MNQKIDIDFQKYLLNEAEVNLRPAKITLRVSAIVNFLLCIVVYLLFRNIALIVTGVLFLVSIIFFALSIYVNKRPRVGVILGLCFYTLVLALYLLSTNFSGWLFIFIVAILLITGFKFLIQSLKIAKEVEELRTTVNHQEGIDLPIDQI